MKRSVEILSILRSGIKDLIANNADLEIKFMRIFNFNENRVSLRMEVANGNSVFVPMGRIDVYELAAQGGNASCDCVLKDFRTGLAERIILRLKNPEQKLQESKKVFSFFESILGVEPKPVANISNSNKPEIEEVTGISIEPTRGAQSKEEKPSV